VKAHIEDTKQYMLASLHNRATQTSRLLKNLKISATGLISHSGFYRFFMKILKRSCGGMMFRDSISSMRV
jgi:hypothetical protein